MRAPVCLLFGAALIAAPVVAVAQTAPAPAASVRPAGWAHHRPPMRGGAPGWGSAMALRGAYAAIGRAEGGGGSGMYLDAAKAHYRDALARNVKSDVRGAMGEARAAMSLARASMALVPPPGPHDVPAPPAVPAGGGMHGAADRPEGGPPMDGPPMGGPGMAGMGGSGGPGAHAWGGPGKRGGMPHHEGGDGVADLAHLASIANTDEAKRLANDALNANLASERAAFAGNRQEAMRQHRLAGDLAGAVRALASLNMTPRRGATQQTAPAH